MKVAKRKNLGQEIAQEDLVRLLECVKEGRADSGRAPTTREIAEALGLSSGSVAWYWVEAACRQGLLARNGRRSLKLTMGGKALLEGWTSDTEAHLKRRIAFHQRRVSTLQGALTRMKRDEAAG